MAEISNLRITVADPRPKSKRHLAKNMLRDDGALALLLVSPPPSPGNWSDVVSRLTVLANYFEQAGWTPPPGYETEAE